MTYCAWHVNCSSLDVCVHMVCGWR